MSNEEQILAGLKMLAAQESRRPRPELEAALLRKVKPRRWLTWTFALEALAAAAVIAIALSPDRSARPVESGFVQVPFVEPLSPNERTQLVRVNVPVGALSKWGLSVTAFNPDQRVNAEVVVGEDGLARAVRFIQ